MPQKSRIVFYGVDEYAGALFSRRAHAAGLAHVAAGRDIARVAAHANALGAGGLVEPRVFGLAHAGRLAAQIDDACVLVNCASPLHETMPPLLEACLATGTHYLDTSAGRAHVAALQARGGEAEKAGIVIMPGADFGFAASNVVAMRLALLLPAARALTIVEKRGLPDRAGARLLLAGLRMTGEVVKNGQFIAAKPASRTIMADLGAGVETAWLAPWWGGAVAARHRGPFSTLEAYRVLPPWLSRLARPGSFAHWRFRRGWGAGKLERRLTRGLEGPSEADLARGRAVIWGEARTPDGRVRRARLETRDAHLYTADAARILAAALARGGIEPGFRLPADVAGAALVDEIEGAVWRELGDPAESLAPDPAALAAH